MVSCQVRAPALTSVAPPSIFLPSARVVLMRHTRLIPHPKLIFGLLVFCSPISSAPVIHGTRHHWRTKHSAHTGRTEMCSDVYFLSVPRQRRSWPVASPRSRVIDSASLISVDWCLQHPSFPDFLHHQSIESVWTRCPSPQYHRPSSTRLYATQLDQSPNMASRDSMDSHHPHFPL